MPELLTYNYSHNYIGGTDVLPVKDPRKYKLNYAFARNFIKDKSRVIWVDKAVHACC